MSLLNDNARRVFALQIAGLEYRYHSINPPASSNLDTLQIPGVTSAPYYDIQAITAVGSFQSSIDPAGGIAQYGAVSIELSVLKSGLPSDPGVVFGRIGKRSGGVSRANLEEDITFNSLPQTIDIDKDLSSLSVPRNMHIGAETFRISSFSSSSMTISHRAVGNTQYQSHRIDARTSSIPFVESEITIFRGRRARLFAANKDAAGNVSDYRCIVNGFIESSPYVEQGTSINLSIVPLVALLDSELSDIQGASTLLMHDKHYFFKNISNVFEFGSAFKEYDALLDNATANATDPAKTDIRIYYPYTALQDVFDVSLPNGESQQATLYHPRYPIMIGRSFPDKLYPVAAFTVSNVNYITVDHSIPGATSATDLRSNINSTLEYQVVIPSRGEIKRFKLGENELKDWPGCINEAINASITTHTGIDGALSRFSIRGNHLVATTLADHTGLDGRLHFWYSSAWYRVSRNYNYAYWRNSTVEDRDPLPNRHRVYYGLDYWQDGEKPNLAANSQKVKTIEFDNVRSTSGISSISVARAYKQPNEPGILVTSSLNLPTVASSGVFFGIEVETVDYVTKEQKVLYYEATHETAIGGGFLIHLRQHSQMLLNGSFGDWEGEQRTTVKRSAISYNISPGEIMLRVLQSGGGGFNGDYDVLGFGLSIHEDNIDVDSFLQNGTVNISSLTQGFSIDDFNPRDFFESLLKSLGCILIMGRSITGLPMIRLQALGTESTKISVQTINAGDWIAEPPPHWSIYEDIVTQVKIKYDWDNSKNKFMQRVAYNNQEAINRYGGEKSSVNIDLYGLNAFDVGAGTGDAYTFFLPIASRIFSILSNPAREWKGSIGTGKSMTFEVGSYITCSSPFLKGTGDEYGVSSEVGMVRSINQELMSEGCDIEILRTGIKVTRWNSTLKVTFITSTTELVVSTNTYSSNDILFFKAGDVVDFVPFGDEDNATTGLTIQSIVGTTITFTSSHFATTLGTIEPTSYASASSDHKEDAYLASSGGVLGTSDDAKEYV